MKKFQKGDTWKRKYFDVYGKKNCEKILFQNQAVLKTYKNFYSPFSSPSNTYRKQERCLKT